MKSMPFVRQGLTLAIAVSLAVYASATTAASVPAGVTLAVQQSIVINNGGEVSSLDPQKIEGVPESNIILNLLEGLVTTDNNGQVVPGVAESWRNEQGRIWTFTLRKDAKWSNGDPVTASDFVYSWQRLADPKTASPYASYLQYAHLVNIDDVLSGKKVLSRWGLQHLTIVTCG